MKTNCNIYNLTNNNITKWRHERSSRLIRNLSNCEREAWKKFRLQRDSNPWPLRYRCSALPTELWSHNCWEQVNFSGSIMPLRVIQHYSDWVCTAVMSKWRHERSSRLIRNLSNNITISSSRVLSKTRLTRCASGFYPVPRDKMHGAMLVYKAKVDLKILLYNQDSFHDVRRKQSIVVFLVSECYPEGVSITAVAALEKTRQRAAPARQVG